MEFRNIYMDDSFTNSRRKLCIYSGAYEIGETWHSNRWQSYDALDRPRSKNPLLQVLR